MQSINKIPGKNPFKIPENYFEEVNRKIISVTSGYDKEIQKIGFYRRFRPYILSAAAVAGIILLSYSTVKVLMPGSKKTQISEIIQSEYSDTYMNDIDLFSLEENVSSLVLNEEGPDVNKTDIIDYLLLENVEISDIYEQL
jgi:hypothetical protein